MFIARTNRSFEIMLFNDSFESIRIVFKNSFTLLNNYVSHIMISYVNTPI